MEKKKAKMAEDTFESYLTSQVGIINGQLAEYIPREASEEFMERMLGKATYKYDKVAITRSVLEPTWYLLALGGKRWRPTLMLLLIEALGKDPKQYLEFSIIPEIIHNATLVHDDMEDGSPTRRGAPAVHVKYGGDIAVNLGGYLYYFPVAALMGSSKLSRDEKDRALMLYIQEMLRVHTGQATDIAWHKAMVQVERITTDEYLQMVYNKTGVLPRMACRLAAVLGGADERMEGVLGNLGASIGVAFQIEDDLLNITPSKLAENKGGIGDDITEGKITLMVIHALQNANPQDKKRLADILKMHTRVKALITEAISIIDKYEGRGYAERRRVALAKEAWAEADKLLRDSPAKSRIKSLIDFLVITRSN